jgi:hypothetical protein
VLTRAAGEHLVVGAFAGAGPWAVVTTAGELLAMYESHRDGSVKPAVVVAG